MDAHAWLQPRLSARAAILVALALTVVAWLENLSPWGPFYVVYAALATWIGWCWRARPRDGAARRGARAWWAAAGVAIGFQLLGTLLFGVVLQAVLASRGVDSTAAQGPQWSVDAALQAVCGERAAAWGVEPRTIATAYFAFIFAWAGFGEEIFYRGLVHGSLQPRIGFGPAAVVSAVLFAVRHATQLAALGRDYPLGTLSVWLAFAFLFGLAMSFFYARTRRLGPPILAHYILNLIPFAAFLAAPPR
jgi:membrane protease YdiL (CAAX protease family)